MTVCDQMDVVIIIVLIISLLINVADRRRVWTMINRIYPPNPPADIHDVDRR